MDETLKHEAWPGMRHAFSRVEGVGLHWAELGRANGRVPLVLLHGLNDSHLTWKHVAPALAHDRLVLMPDLPGHGMSERPDASYELGWQAHLIAMWLEQVGVGLADVVGHSYGGGVSQMLLLECRARIRRLVLVASGGLGNEIGVALRLATIPRVVEFLGQPFMALGTRLALRGSGYSQQDIAEVCAMIAKPGSARAFARTVRDIADWRGQRKTFHQRAHEVRSLPPIAVLWGDRDTMIPITHGKAFADLAEGVVFKSFAGCSHYLHHDRPDLFVAALREFLDTPIMPTARLRTDRCAMARSDPGGTGDG